MTNVDAFIQVLRNCRSSQGVFNPWKARNRTYDVPLGPQLRREHLKAYLEARLETAKYVLVAEALGYQGGRFSGIAMTSERMIAGHHKQVPPGHVLPGDARTRTSKVRKDMNKTQQAMGMAEPTATIVWNTMLDYGAAPDEFVLWNAFPFHPYHPGKGTMNNRSGTQLTAAELETGKQCLQAFFALFPSDAVIAVGEIAAQALAAIGIQPACRAKQPANGGKPDFVNDIAAFLMTRP